MGIRREATQRSSQPQILDWFKAKPVKFKAWWKRIAQDGVIIYVH